ncbi:hypothetical protein M9Y10_025494 [Tritrichomonas musculus]|uniref:Uncharacterized protein n=2 Tax=Tritrichomonas musculus TaxID=1915356 RepID=A0ABR2H8T5_9EUKA
MSYIYKLSDELEDNAGTVKSSDRVNELAVSDLANEKKYYEQLSALVSALNQFSQKSFSIISEGNDEELKYINSDIVSNIILSCFQNLMTEMNEQITVQNILNASKILSFIYSNIKLAQLQFKQLLKYHYLLDLVNKCLHNLNLLSQDQIKEFDFNPFLKIISLSYDDESIRAKALELFPIQFIIKDISPFIKLFINQYGPSLLVCFNSFCSLQHNPSDANIIFNELAYIKNFLTDNGSIIQICFILINMIKHNTIPTENFTENFTGYLTELVGSKDINVVREVLLLIGNTISKQITKYDKLDFFQILFSNINDECIIVYTLWILSFGINIESIKMWIENKNYEKLVNLYPTFSVNSKTELAYFITDMILNSKTIYDEVITFEVLDLLLDSLYIGDNNIVERVFAIFGYLMDDFPNNRPLILQYLMDNGIYEMIAQLRSDEIPETADKIDYFCYFLNEYLKNCDE